MKKKSVKEEPKKSPKPNDLDVRNSQPKEVIRHEEKEEKGREVLKETKEEASERQEKVISDIRSGAAKLPTVTLAQKIAESRKLIGQPLAPGQKLFETPDGEIIMGEADQMQVWARSMNGGKGGWCNPHR